MNIFRFLGDMSHILSFALLLHKIVRSKSAVGISLRTQELFLGELPSHTPAPRAAYARTLGSTSKANSHTHLSPRTLAPCSRALHPAAPEQQRHGRCPLPLTLHARIPHLRTSRYPPPLHPLTRASPHPLSLCSRLLLALHRPPLELCLHVQLCAQNPLHR